MIQTKANKKLHYVSSIFFLKFLKVIKWDRPKNAGVNLMKSVCFIDSFLFVFGVYCNVRGFFCFLGINSSSSSSSGSNSSSSCYLLLFHISYCFALIQSPFLISSEMYFPFPPFTCSLLFVLPNAVACIPLALYPNALIIHSLAEFGSVWALLFCHWSVLNRFWCGSNEYFISLAY